MGEILHTIEKHDIQQEAKVTRNDNIVDIQKPGVGTIRLIYNSHFNHQDPSQLSHDLIGLMPETGLDEYLIDPLATFRANFGIESTEPQTQPLLNTIREKQASIYLCDIPINSSVLIGDGIVSEVGELAIGINVLQKARIFRPIKDRRDFLVRGLKGTLATWLTLPFVSSRLVDTSTLTSVAQEETYTTKRLDYDMHPEEKLLVIKLRNTIMAHKLEHIMKQRGDNPTMNIVLGGHHCWEWPFESTSADRLKFLETYHRVGLLPLLALQPKYIYTGIVYNYSTGYQPETFEVPELKALAQ